MSPILAELFGTAILIVLGDGVVANVVLQRTKGHNSGWIVITAGWAFGVTIAVYCVNSITVDFLAASSCGSHTCPTGRRRRIR